MTRVVSSVVTHIVLASSDFQPLTQLAVQLVVVLVEVSGKYPRSSSLNSILVDLVRLVKQLSL